MDAIPSVPTLLGCSPRQNGNSDAAVSAWLKAFPETVPFQLRSGKVSPCIACGACAYAASSGSMLLPCTANEKSNPEETEPAKGPLFGCPLAAKDDSSRFLGAVFGASTLCVVSPMYFYFFPSQAKALLDRMQPFWELKNAGSTLPRFDRKRVCYAVLLAGRPKGERLFDGSLLSLKCALSSLGYSLAEPLLLRGYDKKEDLASDQAALAQITDYAHQARARELG